MAHPEGVHAIFKMADALKQNGKKVIVHQSSIRILRSREKDIFGKSDPEITGRLQMLEGLIGLNLMELRGEPDDAMTPADTQILRYCTKQFRYKKCMIVTQNEEFAKEIDNYQKFCSIAQIPVTIRAAKVDSQGYLRMYRS